MKGTTMTDTITLTDVLSFVRNATRDDLTALSSATDSRKKVLTAELASELKPGDRVRLGGRISPKYLAGVLATVKAPSVWDKPKAGTVYVEFDTPQGRFGSGCRGPVNLLEPM
jgi:hypothetical protein